MSKITINSKKSKKTYQDGYFFLYDLQDVIGKADDYLIRKLGPWVSAFSFVTNLLVVLTVLCAKKKANRGGVSKIEIHLTQMKQAFFSYMMLNSSLNALYCFIYFLDWTFPCVPAEVEERYSKDNYLQKDVWVSTLASILKLTVIQMSLNRYLLVGKDHLKLLVKAAAFSKRKFSHFAQQPVCF